MSNDKKCITKSSSKLSLSSSDSYQSLSDLTIECCICLEEIENQNSYMPDCLHSWCKECNENLNNNHINNCPICKKPFNSILTNGRWKFTHNYLGGKWKWEKGADDTKNQIRYRKIQQFFLNIGAGVSNLNLGGLTV